MCYRQKVVEEEEARKGKARSSQYGRLETLQKTAILALPYIEVLNKGIGSSRAHPIV